MNVLYCRVSSIDQKTDRQKVKEKDFDLLIEDKCSGAIPFFERPGGLRIKKLVLNKGIQSLSAVSLDRLGRNLLDVLNTIKFFNDHNINIHFINQGLQTLDSKGKENPIAKMMISILGVVSEMERTQLKERQMEGIKVAQLKGVYKGRISGSKEDAAKFLAKEANVKALNYLKSGLKAVEVAKLTDLHPNTITKIKKLGLTALE